MAVVTPGDVLRLQPSGTRLAVLAGSGERIGLLEIRLSQRLARLIDGGNEYEVTLAKAGQSGIAVMIAETRRSDALAGTPSFPPQFQNTLADLDLDDDITGEDEAPLGEVVEDEEATPEPDAVTERVRKMVSGDLLDGLDYQDNEFS